MNGRAQQISVRMRKTEEKKGGWWQRRGLSVTLPSPWFLPAVVRNVLLVSGCRRMRHHCSCPTHCSSQWHHCQHAQPKLSFTVLTLVETRRSPSRGLRWLDGVLRLWTVSDVEVKSDFNLFHMCGSKLGHEFFGNECCILWKQIRQSSGLFK